MAQHAPMDSRGAGLRNEEAVLGLLRQHGELTQTQLCQLVGLSSSTASYIVRRLRNKGLISQRPGKSLKRGARPIILSLRPAGRFAVGVEITPGGLIIGLFDFNGAPIQRTRAPIDRRRAPQDVVRAIDYNVRDLLARHGIGLHKLVGVGVTLSGSISRDGQVQLSAPLNWRNVPLAAMLREQLPDMRVSLHTSRVRLFAEIAAHGLRHPRNVVLLNVANGVGTSVAVDGQLLHGAGDRSGEIGHIIFEPNGALCGCGHRGCLETLIAGPSLAERIRREVSNGRRTLLTALVNERQSHEQVIRAWGVAVRRGDAYALQVRDFVSDQAARAVAVAVNCYDPDTLILSGYVMQQCIEHFIQNIEQRLPQLVYHCHARPLRVIGARGGEQSLILGVATAVLRGIEEF